MLTRYGPEASQTFLAGGDYEISYLPYDWSLNDQSDQGQSYSRGKMVWDRVVDFVTFWK